MITVSNVSFTHKWVEGKGWEKTICRDSDLVVLSYWGSNAKDGDIFVGDRPDGTVFVLKGRFEEVCPRYGKVLTRIVRPCNISI